MNFDAFKRELVQHYAAMAANPGAVDQARHSVAKVLWFPGGCPSYMGPDDELNGVAI